MVDLTEEQYAAWQAQATGQQGGSTGYPQSSGPTQYAPGVNTLQGQSDPNGLGAYTGGGQPYMSGGNTKSIQLSDGTTVLVDMTDGHVVQQFGQPGQEFAQKQALQSQSEASAERRQASQEASADRRQASSEASAERRQQNDPQNDPWRQMMPRYSAPTAVQGERGALDILDPNTGQLMSVRQPGPPPVRIVGGNLIVDPGANAAVYYNGNQGRPTNVSGGPQMVNRGASFPSAMSQAEQIAGRIQNKGQGGAGGAPGGMGGGSQSSSMGGSVGSRGMGGGAGAGNQFGYPGGSPGAQRPLVSNTFANPGPDVGELPRPPWESPTWQDPFNVPGPPGIPESELGGYYNPDIPESELGPYFRNWDIPESELGPGPPIG